MKLMSIPDAAKIYGVPASTIRRWISEGRMVRHGDHRPYGVNAEEVEQLVEKHRRAHLRKLGS